VTYVTHPAQLLCFFAKQGRNGPFVSWLRGRFWGHGPAEVPNFLIVAALGDVHFGGLGRMTAIGHRVDRLPNVSAEMGLVKY
jgi:hypothetical protein